MEAWVSGVVLSLMVETWPTMSAAGHTGMHWQRLWKCCRKRKHGCWCVCEIGFGFCCCEVTVFYGLLGCEQGTQGGAGSAYGGAARRGSVAAGAWL
jgi:hypothetical protein